MPTTKRKPRQFAFILSTMEKRLLREVAERMRRTQADALRELIRAGARWYGISGAS